MADTGTTFRFVEFNPRRVQRGAEGARVEVTDADGTAVLWMSKRDIAKNMMTFGRCPELTKAHEAYALGVPFDAGALSQAGEAHE